MSSAEKVPTNEQKRQIYNYVLENPSITTTQAATLLNIGQRRARNLLIKMVDDRWLNKEGASRSTVYVINHDTVQCSSVPQNDRSICSFLPFPSHPHRIVPKNEA